MRNLVLLVFFFLNISAFAQVSEPFNLQWTKNEVFFPNGKNANTLFFTGASIDQKNNWLPEFAHLQLLGS